MSAPQETIDLTEDDHHQPMVNVVDVDDDDDDDDDGVVYTGKRKAISSASSAPKRPNNLPAVTPASPLQRLEAAVGGRLTVHVAVSYEAAERDAKERRIRLLLVELPPRSAPTSHWYAFLRNDAVARLCRSEFAVVLSVNALSRCVVLEPRTGTARTIDTAQTPTVDVFVGALIDAVRATAFPRAKRTFDDVREVSKVVAVRDLMSQQNAAYASALARDAARDAQRTRLTQQRSSAVARMAERSKRAIAADRQCHVRVRLPDGAVLESVFDSAADTVQALVDFVTVEASLRLRDGDQFDATAFRLMSQFPKRCVSADPDALLADALGGGGKRVALVLEEAEET
jgi:hypothetical protein